ncbi:MAG: BrnT family toxin, partial [Geminocystis sp. GBBB08]|nr:BrnT family toxin [Geminocystis sp. GBBB08]
MQNLDREFEWDEGKNIKNQKKHKIRFEDAIAVFNYPM